MRNWNSNLNLFPLNLLEETKISPAWWSNKRDSRCFHHCSFSICTLFSARTCDSIMAWILPEVYLLRNIIDTDWKRCRTYNCKLVSQKVKHRQVTGCRFLRLCFYFSTNIVNHSCCPRIYDRTVVVCYQFANGKQELCTQDVDGNLFV